MEELILRASERFPEIRFRDGFISIKGHSIPQDPKKFYTPVLQWVKGYMKDPAPHTEVSLNIDYSDTGSTKAIYDILKLLAICQNTNHKFEIVFNWIYQKGDDDIKEMGEFLESKLDVTFNYHEESYINQGLFKGYS
jgi:hypothetical protein